METETETEEPKQEPGAVAVDAGVAGEPTAIDAGNPAPANPVDQPWLTKLQELESRLAFFEQQPRQPPLPQFSQGKRIPVDFDGLAKNYGPDLAEALKAINDVAFESSRHLEFRDQQRQAWEHQNRLDANERELAKHHPDWKTIAGKEEFKGWFSQQEFAGSAPLIANAIHDTKFANFVLGRYKEFQAKHQQKQANRLESGVGPSSRSPGAGSGPPEDLAGAFRYFVQQDQKKGG
ncbi:MAG: hypothetical protein H7833_00450 [Magnetococcus sp. DMHC-1]